MAVNLNDAELYKKYSAIADGVVAEADRAIREADTGTAILWAEDAVGSALEAIRTAAFEIATGKGPALKRGRAKMDKARAEYIKAKIVLNRLTKFAEAGR